MLKPLVCLFSKQSCASLATSTRLSQATWVSKKIDTMCLPSIAIQTLRRWNSGLDRTPNFVDLAIKRMGTT